MADGNDVVTDLLVRNLLEILNEKDGAIRRALLVELWSEDAIFIDPEAAHQGTEKIDKAIAWLAQCFPGSPSPWLVPYVHNMA
ncbi:nuclear transport factor 2 family protein [Granulicella tundricola]|uniref:nuclear transport factor 2 family protein n=1 Tax=Granulicella tundricola TaxID=940615 RepID=UPI0001DB7F82|nr:nuclear transport factor 2 family protein [Granulicella tundricola]